MNDKRGSKSIFIERNRSEYKKWYSEVNWIKEEEIDGYEIERSTLLSELENYVQWGYHASKADVSSLSPGCRLCGEGEWSCLFINNVCNARCFYCPSKQDDVSVPTTSAVTFQNPEDYVAYLRRFNYKGASISGGEPFLSFDKTLRFIKTIRKELGNEIYIWMYTNGILAEKEKFKELASAGLDEVRFDISAAGYRLEPVKKAAGIIRNITVEIPAIPEDLEIIRELLPQMKNAGVDFLNLHQIRLTDYNFSKLKKRGYTFLHGPKATVLESELTALKVMLHSYKEKINLPVNYCSYIYRYRFQSRAARIKQTAFFTHPHETITETGLIRNIILTGTDAQLNSVRETIKRICLNGEFYKDEGDALIIHETCLKPALKFDVNVSLNYHATKLRNSLTYKFPFKEIHLNNNKPVFVERGRITPDIALTKKEAQVFENIFCVNNQPFRKEVVEIEINRNRIENSNRLMEVFEMEKLDHGLYPYF
ncbi:MAG: radical SAM protein [Bacteroidales bacterium]|nr:radical SAM protein [Bacteroidales bacterium]MCF8332548.1 radical SAM protein [Bacteroidales bacterium]